MPNPFDVLPQNLFNLLGTRGDSSLQEHYMAILLRIYSLGEFNRYGLARDVVLAEIVDYLRNADADAEIESEMADQAQTRTEHSRSDAGESGSITGQKSAQDYASYLIRRLEESGWIEREQHADYSETIALPDYAFTLLEAFRKIEEQKPHEFSGQIYTAHQLIKSSKNKDFSPALAVTQAYENVRQMVRGLSELNQNIRRYVERAMKEKDIADLLHLQFNDYSQTLGASYHALKTSDHVSRYRRDIINQMQKWQLNAKWLEKAGNELALQSRLTPVQAEQTLASYMQFVIVQLEDLDPLLAEIDQRHAQYLRTSLRQIRYQLGNSDGSFKDRLVSLARRLAEMDEAGIQYLPADAPALRHNPIDLPDIRSYYTPPQKRAPFMPANVVKPILRPEELASLNALTMRDVLQALSPAKVNRKVLAFFNGNEKLHVSELPAEISGDLRWFTTILAYAHHPEVSYGIEMNGGEIVDMGAYRVEAFELVRER